jgi:hypothetical protein
MIVMSFGVAVLWTPKGGADMPGISIGFFLTARSFVE